MSSTEEAKQRRRRVPQLHTLKWSDLPEGHDPPLAVVRATEHPEYPEHHHEFWEIVIVTRGTGLMGFGTKALPIKVGDVFVISRDHEHAYRETHSLDIVNIAFDPAFIASVHPVLEDWMSRDALFAVGPRWRSGEMPGECLHLGPTEFARVLELVQRLEGELESASPEARVAAFAYFLLLITLLRRHCLPWEALGDAALGTRIGRAVEFIENHFAESITIDDIAARSHVSRRHFFRLFEQAVGIAPMEYLKKVRLQKAAAMLLTTKANVTEVAYACGFSDSNYFSTLYHKEFGISPSRFKKDGRAG
jgi:AraC-like DNA-binding protein/mannose-6-phosphate isomerase-like protein (cupin superfamily)